MKVVAYTDALINTKVKFYIFVLSKLIVRSIYVRVVL